MTIPLDRNLLEHLAEFFAAAGVDACLVGGSVRDWLLGRAGQDLDLAVNGDALALTRGLADALDAAYVLLDEEHPTARAVLRRRVGPTQYIDVAQWRADTLEADLAARDFTVNAMAIHLADALSAHPAVIDPWGGQRDLVVRQLRAVSEGAFENDPLRLLRAVRLAAELGFEIEAETRAWIRRHAGRITQPSAERVRDELVCLLAQPGAAGSLRRLDTLGLLASLVPELEACKDITPPVMHAGDVFDHSLVAVERLEEVLTTLNLVGAESPASRPAPLVPRPSCPAPHDVLLRAGLAPFIAPLHRHLHADLVGGRPRFVLLKLLTLLHDVGKPETCSTDERGIIHFYGHEQAGAAMVRRILHRLRFGVREVGLGGTVIRHHMRPQWLARAEQVTNRAIYRFFRDVRDGGIDITLLCLADLLAQRPEVDTQALERQLHVTRRLWTAYYQDRRVVEPPPLVTGRDLMMALGLEEGPCIGELLEAIREAQAAGEVSTHEEALEFARQRLSVAES